MRGSGSPSRRSSRIVGVSPFQKTFNDSFRRGRKRSRNNSTFASLQFFAITFLALSSGSTTKVFAGETAVLRRSDDNGDTVSTKEDITRKPYRPVYGGRLKLVPTRKLIRVATIENDDTTPWIKDRDIERNEQLSTKSQQQSPTIIERFSPFLKRGILLAGLTAVAVIDKQPPSQALLASAGASSSWFPSLRLDWNKLWSLPGEILPSLSAAMMIAWIPNLILQKAYFELAFLFCSLTSQSTLRNYLVTEVLPSLGGTARKLIWSEFWKQAWDYILDPFPHNLLLPSKFSSEQRNENVSQWQIQLSQFWSDRVISRIDKWTASSVKALLQKNVQSSVNGLAEDTWKAAAYAWYPDDRRLLEDTARIIEIECEDNDENCRDNNTWETSSNGESLEEEDLQERIVNDDQESIAKVEVLQEVSIMDETKEQQAILASD